MNDLLSKQASSSIDLEEGRNRAGTEHGVEMAGTNRGQSLAIFFEKIGILKSETDKMKQRLGLLQDLHEESLGATSSSTIKSLREKMDAHMHALSKHAKMVKEKLKDLDLDNIENRKVPGCEAGSATDRTRLSITNSIHKALADVVTQFHAFRDSVNFECRDTARRRYFAITGDTPSEETLDRIAETGQSEVFLRAAISQQGDPRISSLQLDIILLNERHDALKDVHHNLSLLHQTFMDMAVLIDDQGQKIDSIEGAIEHASSFVADGTRKLQEAKNIRNNSRKWTLICIIILIIIIIIVIIIVVKELK